MKKCLHLMLSFFVNNIEIVAMIKMTLITIQTRGRNGAEKRSKDELMTFSL